MLNAVRVFATFVSAFTLSALPVAAADYPARPVTLVVGLAAGGGTDSVARILADWMSRSLSQRVVVENRPGMGGNLGAQAAISAPADGYTLLFMGPNNAIATSLYKKLPFNFLRDTVPVAGVMRLTNLMTVPPSLPVNTVQDFIDYAKKNPGKLSMASTGVGTSVHLSGELFKAMTKTDMVHVPYRGSSPAYPDLITGKVHVLFGNLTGSIKLVQAKKLRGLGVTSAKRWEGLPDIPTVAETVPGYVADVWYGVVAPKGTPPEIVSVLNKAINAGLADPTMRVRFEKAGGVPMPMSPAEFGRMVASETEKWRKVVEFAGVSVD
ncbi:MAG: tripartite tricarboxylate transporter substrate binding protein [Rhizobiales bacterium]|nr:tripartite tricarboxylate transporter substrate binding protein [Hyphomicrobiales bacterium]